MTRSQGDDIATLNGRPRNRFIRLIQGVIVIGPCAIVAADAPVTAHPNRVIHCDKGKDIARNHAILLSEDTPLGSGRGLGMGRARKP